MDDTHVVGGSIAVKTVGEQRRTYHDRSRCPQPKALLCSFNYQEEPMSSRTMLLLNDTRRAGHHGSSAVVDILIKELARRNVKIRSQLTDPVQLDALAANGISALIVNGEGSMHGGQKSCVTFAKAARQAREQGIPAHLINSVYFETSREIAAEVASFSTIHVRESASQAALAQFGISSAVVPDLTLSLSGVPTWSSGSRVVVTDSTLHNISANLHSFARNSGFEFLTLRFPSQTNSGRALKFNLRRHVGKMFPTNFTFNRYSSAVDEQHAFLMRLTQGVRVAIAARFHAVCFCLNAGVPFLAVASNTNKITGMLKDAGLAHRILPRLDEVSIAACAPWTPVDDVRRQRYVAEAKQLITRMLDVITSPGSFTRPYPAIAQSTAAALATERASS